MKARGLWAQGQRTPLLHFALLSPFLLNKEGPCLGPCLAVRLPFSFSLQDFSIFPIPFTYPVLQSLFSQNSCSLLLQSLFSQNTCSLLGNVARPNLLIFFYSLLLPTLPEPEMLTSDSTHQPCVSLMILLYVAGRNHVFFFLF